MPVDKFGRMSDLKTKDTGVSLTYINNNYVRSDGETPLTGSLDMRGNTLYNVADPVNPQDVVTKVYVDNTKGSGVIGRKTGNGVSIKENLDFLGKQRIKNLPDPVNDHDAVTKKYVDEKDAVTKEYIDEKDAVTKEYIDEKDAVTKEYIDEKDAVTKKYVDDKTKNLFIDKNDNIAFGLNVDMEGNQILGLPEPVQDEEPATKKYVDDLQTQYIDKRGNVKFDRNINVGNNRIFAVKDPKKDYEATNKKYVDDTINKRLQEEKDNFLPQDPATKEYVDEAIKQVAGGDILVSKEGVFIKANGHYRATAPLDIDNHKMENLPDPVDDKDAVNKKYIDGIVENLTLKQGLIRENGGFNLVDSYINMNFQNIRNVGLPKDESDAVPKRFVESMIKEVSPFLKENGNYQTSTSIDMKFNKLFNLQKPTEPYDAVTKDYVDYVEKEIKEKLEKEIKEKLEKEIKEKPEKKKQLITVYARYCGSLKEGDYPFNFGGGNSFENCEELIGNNYRFKSLITGFVMPHKGQIRKIICEGLTYIEKNKIFEKLITLFNEEQIKELKKYFGKEDFKNDLLEKIKNTVDFTTDKINERPLQEGKIFFELTKSSKSFNSGNGNSFFSKPVVISGVMITHFKWKEIEVSSSINELRAIMQIINVYDRVPYWPVYEEGDTLNIRISDFKKNLFGRGELIDNILKPIVIFLLGTLNFNFTFLIELDPL